MGNTNIHITLDTRRAKNDGTYPLVLRVSHQERTASIPLGISIEEKYWDEESRQIKKSYPGASSVTRLNNHLQKKKAEATDTVLKLAEAGRLETLSATDIKQVIEKKHTKASFFDFADALIDELITAQRIGTARSYKGVLAVLRAYRGGKDLSFAQLNYSFLMGFEAQHLNKGHSYNGLAVYMRTIRAIYNKAIRSGAVEKELYPFDDYKIRTVPTEKRALEWESIQKILALEISPADACFHARNYFVASYMMYGMNFTDMAFLRKENIVDGRIQYRRKKTGKLYDIKITAGLEKILSYYLSAYKDAPFIFPIIRREALALQYKDIQWARKRYDKRLKLLAEHCGIEKNLTSYVSRHSFATQAMMQQVPITAISAMLGHSSIKTTEIYLKSLPNNVLDAYNEKLLGG